MGAGKINWRVLILSFLAVFLTAFIGSRVTKIGNWYESVKPSITPPNYVFPIVWTFLFILIWLSLYLTWKNAGKKQKLKVGVIFGINLFLNALWSYLFFGLQKPLFAFYDLILLWISIIAMLIIVYRISKTSFLMLIAYFLWVGFAGILNWLIAFG